MPAYYKKLSLILSRIMNAIGVNEECVMRQRRTNLIRENIFTLTATLVKKECTSHIFGSQTEGTSTDGLQSDIDTLYVDESFNVIQDWKDWVPDKINLLMIQDVNVSPGYCILQRLRSDMPLAMDVVPDEDYMYDEEGRVILKNTCIATVLNNGEMHGPAFNSHDHEFVNMDFVIALPCETAPLEYKQWTSRERMDNWPTPEMIEYMESKRCFVVPCGHRLSQRPEREWRISTSLSERCLMFSLNITQIRCYVLLKMILKTFIEPHVPDVISSYICKTLLFQCLERSRRDFWKECNLIQCVNHVLLYMLAAVYTMDCPNYFNEASNLFVGKVDRRTQEILIPRIQELVKSQGRFLLRVEFDSLNSRLTRYITNPNSMLSLNENENHRTLHNKLHSVVFCGEMSASYALLKIKKEEETRITLIQTIKDFTKRGILEQRAAVYYRPFICSYLAAVDASECIRNDRNVSQKSLLLYKHSLGSDVASSRLKYASYLYCTGQFQEALNVLQDVEKRMGPKVVSICGCTSVFKPSSLEYHRDEPRESYPSTSRVALCVSFKRAESQCCPREMQFEFNRSTEVEKLHRRYGFDDWMDLAILDSLPYLYYLQYMTARHLRRRDLQRRALYKLELRVCSGPGHRETAYNVLGQCFELENNVDKALMYYRRSLQLRPTNNAARWLLAILVWNAIRHS